MLLAMGVLHATGFDFVSEKLAEADVPQSLQKVLPVLYLYPSAIVIGLSVFAMLSTRMPGAAPLMLTTVTIAVFAHAILGFLLGGALPGVVVSVAGCMFLAAAYLLSKDQRGSTS